MDLTRSRIVLAVLFMLSALPISAQTAAGQEDKVSLSQVNRLRAEAERDRALADDLQAQILELYDVAISSLGKADDNRTAIADFKRERSGIDRIVASLRAELEKPKQPPHIQRPANPTVAQAEDALARERARLDANRKALRNQERIAEDRAKLRNDISQRLGELDLELELLTDELRRQSESAARTELKVAVRASLLARRDSVISETEMLRARLDLLTDRSSLIPLETDLVQRRVSFSQELVAMLEEATHDLRAEQARDSLGRIREQGLRLSEELPTLAPLVAETVELAETLWAPDGIVTRSELAIKALDDIRHHQAQLNRIAELTSRKFEAYGHRGSVTRWWPDLPEDFPEPGNIAKSIQDLDEEIPEVEHRLITYEQQRSASLDLTRQTMLVLQNELGEDPDPELAQRVRDLLAVRQDTLDELIQRAARYSNQLVEYRTASDKFLRHVRDVERFLFSHILWSRSVPKPIIPRLRDIGEAMGWFTSTDHLESVSVVGLEFTGSALFLAFLLVLIVLLRQPARRRLHEIAERVADPERDSLGSTIAASVLTAVLAAPLPLVLYIAGNLIDHASTDCLHAVCVGNPGRQYKAENLVEGERCEPANGTSAIVGTFGSFRGQHKIDVGANFEHGSEKVR